jgi:hypothetical protein
LKPKKIAIGIILVAVIIAIFIIIVNVNKETEVSIAKAENIAYEYFVLYGNNDKVGVVDKTGKLLIDTEYTDIYIPNASKDVFLCYKDEDCTVLNKDGKEIYTEFEEVNYLETSEATELVLESEVLRYKKDNLYGLLSIEGEVLTDAIYEKVSSLNNKPGVILVKQDGKYGVLDTKGNEIIPTKYDSIVGDEYCLQDYEYNLAGYIVSQKTDTGVMYGYIDCYGKTILNTEYETISRALEYEDIDDLYLVVRSNGKKGVFKNGKQIIDFEYQSINYADKSNVFIVEKTGKYGFFTNTGKEILKPKYTKYGIAGNYISVQDGENTMLYDLNGNLINKDNYLSMIEVENSSYFIAINESGFYSIISKDTQINEDYTYITYAFDNYFIVTNVENKTGVIDVWNGTVIEPQYDSIINVEGTKVLECRNAETGEVDIYDAQIDKVCTISDAIVEKVDENYIRAYSDSQMQYFDSTGKSVKNTEVFKDKKLYSYSQDGKWGFCDKDGKVVIEAEYDIVTEIDDYGFAGIKKDGKWGIIDENGKIIVEPSYELETYYFPKFVGKYQLELIDTLHCIEI